MTRNREAMQMALDALDWLNNYGEFREGIAPSPIAAAAALRAALSEPVAAPPAGYVMVPVEPTEDMRREFEDCYHGARGYQHSPFKSAYKAMLSAAKRGE